MLPKLKIDLTKWLPCEINERDKNELIKIKPPLFQWGPVDACVSFMYHAAETCTGQSTRFYQCPTWTPGLIFFRNGLMHYITDQTKLFESSLIFTERNILAKGEKNNLEKTLMGSLKIIEDTIGGPNRNDNYKLRRDY